MERENPERRQAFLTDESPLKIGNSGVIKESVALFKSDSAVSSNRRQTSCSSSRVFRLLLNVNVIQLESNKDVMHASPSYKRTEQAIY